MTIEISLYLIFSIFIGFCLGKMDLPNPFRNKQKKKDLRHLSPDELVQTKLTRHLSPDEADKASSLKNYFVVMNLITALSFAAFITSICYREDWEAGLVGKHVSEYQSVDFYRNTICGAITSVSIIVFVMSIIHWIVFAIMNSEKNESDRPDHY